MFMLGELTAELMIQSDHAKVDDENFYVDLKKILQNPDYTTGQCVECHQFTSTMCEQCHTVLCENCFKKSHKTHVVFKTHVLQKTDPTIKCNKCRIHTEKTLDYYCKDCKKSICMDCLMVGGEKSCKNHDTASMQEVNEGFVESLNELFPKVDETFRILTKTAVDIGNLLYNMENETQKHKTDVISLITKLKVTEKESLYKAKEDITLTIKKAKEVLNTMTLPLKEKKMKQINLSTLLHDAKVVAESPWYLMKDENLNVAVNEDVCNLISDYIQLEAKPKSAYTLRSTTELDEGTKIPKAPIRIVYPPEFCDGDVRQKRQKHEKAASLLPLYQQVPKFRSKTGSTSALNLLKVNDATRFSESTRPRLPKQFREDSHVVIKVSHIVHPHNFFVQLLCDESLIHEMKQVFKNYKYSQKPLVKRLREEKLFLAYNQRLDMWQRVRIVSIDFDNPAKPLCTVFSIDFGNKEVVSIDALRLLRPEKYKLKSPLAFNCCLANCEAVPKNRKWTTDDAGVMANIVMDKPAVMHIRKIWTIESCRESLFCDITTCDITTYEEDSVISLAHALAERKLARLVNPGLPYPKMTQGGAHDSDSLAMPDKSFEFNHIGYRR